MNLSDFPHRRFNPLTGEWTLVSCHRTKRPWHGKPEAPPLKETPTHDPKCGLCPGNVRAGNQANPDYDAVFTFDNDFPALLPDIPLESLDERGLLVAQGEQGRSRIVSYSPIHNLSMSLMPPQDILGIVEAWRSEWNDLASLPETGSISIFESRGELLGVHNPHPHCQIIAHASTPCIPARETIQQREYFAKHKACLLCSYVETELAMKARIVAENDHFLAVVPFWAAYPFEVLVVPKQHAADVTQMSSAANASCADMLHRIAVRLDNLHCAAFPYAMGVHQRPIGTQATSPASMDEWHFHIHFFPPLSRIGATRKWTAAFELMFMNKRDSTPEAAARKLRGCSDIHFTKQNLTVS